MSDTPTQLASALLERDEAERENEQLLASNKTYERDWPVLVHERDEAQDKLEVMTAKAMGWQNQAELNANLLVECREKAERYRLEANAMMAKLHELQTYADRLADGLPVGMLPRDVENLQEANAGLAEDLQKAKQERDKAQALVAEMKQAIIWAKAEAKERLHRLDQAACERRTWLEAHEKMRRERDEQTAQMCQAIGYLSTIAEDCEAWLNGESDEPSMEFIKAVRDYARKAVSK